MAWSSCCTLLLLVVAAVSRVKWSAAQNVTRPVACSAGRNSAPLCDCRFVDRPQVSCQARGLTVVPVIFPYNVTVVTLLQNAITQIYEDDFQGLEKVETLFLQENRIETIHPLAFRNMYKLRMLILHDNRLKVIPADLFQHLPSLREINLQRNLISQISRYAFATLRNVTIRFNENPLVCDCEAWTLQRWLGDSQASVQLLDAVCQDTKRPLAQLSQKDVPNCGNSEKVYDPTLFCHTCQNAGSMRQCRDNGSVQPCQGPQNACTTELSLNQGYLVIQKRCMAVSSCLAAEWNNAQGCGVDQASTSNFRCHFCCLDSRCNRPLNSSQGRTREVWFRVSLQVTLPKGASFGDVTNNTGLIIASAMKSILASASYGGYDVTYVEARDPATTFVYTIQGTVVNTPLVGRRDVRDVINATLQARLAQTFTGDARLVPASLQFGDLPDPDQGHVMGACPQETQDTAYGSFAWPPTLVGQSARLPCPHDTWEPGFLATRTCAAGETGAEWQTPFLRMCRFQSSTTQALQDLANTRIDRDSAPGVARSLASLARGARDFARDDVRLAADVAANLLAEPSVLQSRDTLGTLVATFSDLTSVPVAVLREAQDQDKSSNKLLSAIELVGSDASLQDGSLVAVEPRLALVAVPLSPSLPFPGLQLSASTQPGASLEPGKVEVRNGTGAEADAASRTSIALPRSLLAPGSPASRVAFNVFQSDSLFSAIQTDDFETTTVTSTATSPGVISDTEQPSFVTRVNSHVIAASVPGVTVANLREPVLISLSHRDQGGANPRCVFWDEDQGRWSGQGCRVNFTSATHTVCACDHLTNFALVMDVYQTGGGLSEADQRALSIISYIGCGVSLLGLLLTLTTYMLFRCGGGHAGQDSNQGESGGSRKLRKDNPSKILINLCVALAAACLVFVIGQQPYSFASPEGCKAVGVLLHYFLLASLTWMAVQAFYMYLALVLVFNTYFAHFMLKCAAVGWGVPLVVVAITLGINKTDNYGLIGENFCWLQSIPFYAAFVAPVLLILLLNFLAFGLVLRNLLGFSARKLTKSSDRTSIVTQLRGAIGIVILLGLTWIFAIFAIGGASVVFHYLFAIFNSLQGLFIFLFYCLLKKDARTQWRRLLPCCGGADDKSSSAATSSRGGESISTTSRHTVRQTINSDSDVRPRGQPSHFVNHRGEVIRPRQETNPVATSDVRLEAFYRSSATSI